MGYGSAQRGPPSRPGGVDDRAALANRPVTFRPWVWTFGSAERIDLQPGIWDRVLPASAMATTPPLSMVDAVGRAGGDDTTIKHVNYWGCLGHPNLAVRFQAGPAVGSSTG
jgi:hypothetical protein